MPRSHVFGDFQTPDQAAKDICRYLGGIGIRPDVIIEPTCGLGSFVMASCDAFPEAREIHGWDIHLPYVHAATTRFACDDRVRIHHGDVFAMAWDSICTACAGAILFLGNPPWVTSADIGSGPGANRPVRQGSRGMSGVAAMTGMSNFDIAEHVCVSLMHAARGRPCDMAVLVKTSVARRILTTAEREQWPVSHARMVSIPTRSWFGVDVPACLLIMRCAPAPIGRPWTIHVFASFDDRQGRVMGYRHGLLVGDMDAYDAHAALMGTSPITWRSGIKHDAAAIMELQETSQGFRNGLGEVVDIEASHRYPLLKGTHVLRNRPWSGQWMLVPHERTGASTSEMAFSAPQAWSYVQSHAPAFAARKSRIYTKGDPYAIFGVGPYTFAPWKVAIAGFAKSPVFMVHGPVHGKPVVYDDTVAFIGCDNEDHAQDIRRRLHAPSMQALIRSMVCTDQKRPMTTSLLNRWDWSRVTDHV